MRNFAEARRSVNGQGLQFSGKGLGFLDQGLFVAFQKEIGVAGAARPFNGIHEQGQRALLGEELEDIRFEMDPGDRNTGKSEEQAAGDKYRQGSGGGDGVDPLQMPAYQGV